MTAEPAVRIGIDLGGTKIAGIALGPGDAVLADTRRATPREDYAGSIAAIAEMVTAMEGQIGCTGTLGVGIPGSQSPVDGLIQNANSTWLNGMALKGDLEHAVKRPVRLANDANCFALSEATDGNAAGANSVFGVIIGTGCGGGIVIDGRIVDGPHGIAGEWGHTPLPNPDASEHPGPLCWCGRRGCMETWVSGPAVVADHERHTGHTLTVEEITALADAGDGRANETLDRLAGRLARGHCYQYP